MRRKGPLKAAFDEFLGKTKENNQHDPPSFKIQKSYRQKRSFRQAIIYGIRKHKKLLALLLLTVVSSSLVLGPYLWLTYDNSWRTTNSDGVVKAALVDELSATAPNAGFTIDATRTLTAAGYKVDYYGPSKVTVGFFRDLPRMGYGLVIFRAHSGISSIYTSEPYSKWTYIYEQLTGQVIPVVVDNVEYFGITPSFVENSMRGSFQGSLIIAMGCSGLSDVSMANAFIQKGATSYVGWNTWVSSTTTDTYVTMLLQSLSHGKTVRESLVPISNKLSSDPSYAGRLSYYDASTAPKEHATSFLKGLSTLAIAITFVGTGPIVAFLVVKAASGDLTLSPIRRIKRGRSGKPRDFSPKQ